MNNLFIGILSSLIITGSFFGSLAQEANSLLWKISGKELTKPSYLFGTIHMLPQDKYFFTEQMEKALNSSEVLALEVDMDVSMADQIEMAKELMMPDGKTWKDHLTEDEFSRLRSVFIDTLGIKAGKFDKQYVKIKPIYVSGLIMPELLGKVKMYEKELTSMAKKGKKSIIGLETIKEQMAIVSSVSLEDQIAEVKEMGGNIITEYNVLLDAYLAQNLEEMGELARNEVGFDKIEAKLLTERNDKWVGVIQNQAGESSTFFAVGAMHLVGESGLIRQLRNAGYNVEAVN